MKKKERGGGAVKKGQTKQRKSQGMDCVTNACMHVCMYGASNIIPMGEESWCGIPENCRSSSSSHWSARSYQIRGRKSSEGK